MSSRVHCSLSSTAVNNAKQLLMIPMTIILIFTLLYLLNIICYRTKPSEILHPTPLPSHLSQQAISPYCKDSDRVDDLPYSRIWDGRILPVRTCRISLGSYSAWKVHQFSGELKDLNLNLRKKIALIFLFALRSFACITSMIRLKYIIAYGTSVDVTYRNVDIVLWSVLEDYVAIICAGLMCFRPLAQARGNSKLASKLGAGVKGYELHSQNDEAKDRQGKAIRVQKTWFTQTSSAEELPERSYLIDGHGRSEELWQDRRT
ncbi:hypothetical protein V499_01181 [Pseudogymnoascus sp. VKM F-103]|nr:hypothetical protein V499_01181 [Pseudogymnoascus sp. VKM F-103]